MKTKIIVNEICNNKFIKIFNEFNKICLLFNLCQKKSNSIWHLSKNLISNKKEIFIINKAEDLIPLNKKLEDLKVQFIEKYTKKLEIENFNRILECSGFWLEIKASIGKENHTILECNTGCEDQSLSIYYELFKKNGILNKGLKLKCNFNMVKDKNLINFNNYDDVEKIANYQTLNDILNINNDDKDIIKI